jgi:hypothetical protein
MTRSPWKYGSRGAIRFLVGCRCRPGRPDTVPDEAAILEAVYTLLGSMAAVIGQPRGINFGDLAARRSAH